MSHINKLKFDYDHFNAFAELGNLKCYDMMASISIFSLAIACCYIDDGDHLQDIIDFMTFKQQKAFKSLIASIQQVPPNPEFVVDVQQMIMHLFEHSGQTMSVLATVAYINDISFSKGLSELANEKGQVVQCHEKRNKSAPIFSTEKLTAEMVNRKSKDL